MKYELFRWWAFRRIKHVHMAIFNWWAPLSLTALAYAWFYFTPYRPNFFGDSGVADLIFDIFQILPAFFIAALVAVVSFGNDSLDEEMGEEGPKLEIDYGEDGQEFVTLTPRRLLCYLFSYVTILGLLIFVASGICSALITEQGVISVFGSNHFLLSSSIFVVATYFCFCVFVSLLQAVFFLSERMHQL